MAKLTVYQKPTCTTCRQLSTYLKENGVEFDAVDYFLDPIPGSKLQELVKKMGVQAREIIREKEDRFKQLGLKGKELSDKEWIDLMVKYPELIQRPIVEKGNKAILARPVENIKQIL